MLGDRSMSWIDSGGLYGDIILDLVDGYVPRKDTLLKLAKQSSAFAFQGEINPDNWDSDSLYQNLADCVRHSFCTQLKRPNTRTKQYCEAWLLNSHKGLGSDLELKDVKSQTKNRRLLVTLHYDCRVAKQCLKQLLEQTKFDVIAEDQYKDYTAFEKAARDLLEAAATPFLAPCLVAQREMEKCGYRCVGFGR